MKKGQIRKLDELLLFFNGTSFTLNSHTEFSIDCLELPLPVDKFYPGTIWKLRVLNYNEDIGELITENMRYHFHDDAEFINDGDDKQIKNSFYFDGIEKIKFRSLNTASFLKSVILKKENIPDAGSSNTIVKNEAVHENIILKTIKVPLAKVKFLYGKM